MIDWKDQKYRPITDQEGRKVEAVAEKDNKLIGIYFSDDGSWAVATWHRDGAFVGEHIPSVFDLIQAPKRVERNFWANLYLYDTGSPGIFTYPSKHNAMLDKEKGQHATAIPVTITTEGDKIIIHGEGKVNNEGEKV